MTIPRLLYFEGRGDRKKARFAWRRVAFREPKKGEYYVSGAIPAAYQARADMQGRYLVIEPVGEAER